MHPYMNETKPFSRDTTKKMTLLLLPCNEDATSPERFSDVSNQFFPRNCLQNLSSLIHLLHFSCIVCFTSPVLSGRQCLLEMWQRTLYFSFSLIEVGKSRLVVGFECHGST